MTRLAHWLVVTFAALGFLIGFASPAAADPASMIISALAINTATIGGALAATAIRIGVGMALSYVGRVLMGQQDRPKPPGIRTESTTEGGSLPQTRLLGRVATAGNLMMPSYAWGESDDIENAFRYTMIDLADHRITDLVAVWVDGNKFNLANMVGTATGYDGLAPAAPGGKGWTEEVDGVTVNNFMIRWRDGTQGSGSADPSMVDKFSSHPKRPFTSAMYGKGIAYARVRFHYKPDLYRGDPRLLFECHGEPLYQLRKDTSRGGSGTHRLGTESTYEYTDNPFDMIYNVLAGLPLDEGGKWGCFVEEADLPFAPWSQAISYCNDTVGYGQRYRAGIEIRMANPEAGGDTPLDIIDELLKACSGAIADCGGEILARCGPPGASVVTITDDDILLDEAQDFTLHEGLTGVFNMARGTHPRPESMWEDSEVPPYINTAAQAQDGFPLMADLAFPAVFSRPQVKKLLRDYVDDSRRVRRHTITLGFDYSNLQPLDAISWTSTRNGYSAKRFEIDEIAHNPLDLSVTLSIRERDPADYDWTSATDDAAPSEEPRDPENRPLPGWSVTSTTIEDKDGQGRDPAIVLSWSKKVPSQRIQYQGRRVGTTARRFRGVVENDGDGEVTIAGRRVHPKTAYEFRARGKSPKTEWSAWVSATTPNVRIRRKDLENNAIGGRKGKPKGENIVPLWDIDDDVEPQGSDDETFEVSGSGTPTYTIISPGNSGRKAIRLTKSTGNAAAESFAGDRAPSIGGEKYYIEARARASTGTWSGGQVQFQARFYDENDVLVGTQALRPSGAYAVVTTSWATFEDRVKAPDTARSVGLRAYLDTAGPSYIDVDRIVLLRANAASRIDDKAIGKRQMGRRSVAAEALDPTSRENILPLWDIDTDVRPSTDADPTFEIGGAASYTVVNTDNKQGRAAILLQRTSAADGTLNTFLEDLAPVAGGERFWIEATAKAQSGSESGGDVQFQVRWYDADKNLVGTNACRPDGDHITLTTTWQTFEDRVTAPDTARYAGLRAVILAASSVTQVRLDRLVLARANAAKKLNNRDIKNKHIGNGEIKGRARKPHTLKNLIPLWDIDSDVTPSDDENPSFSSGNSTYALMGSANTGRQSVRVTRESAGAYDLKNFEDSDAPVSGSTKYYVETMLRTSGASGANGLVQVQFQFFRADGITSVGTTVLKPNGSHPGYDGTYRKFSARITAPSDARLVRYRVYVDASGPSWVDVDRVMMDEATGGEKIHDGDVRTRHVKPADIVDQVRFNVGGPINTPGVGSRRNVVSPMTINANSEWYVDFEFSMNCVPYAKGSGSSKTYKMKSMLELWLGDSEKLRSWPISFGVYDSGERPITVTEVDTKKRSGSQTYRLKLYTPSDEGGGFDLKNIHAKLRIIKR